VNQGLGASSVSAGSRNNANSFVERTLLALNETLERSFFAEESARKKGLLQEIDPRVKVWTTLGLLIVVSLSRSLPALLGLFALAASTALLSAIPAGFLAKRVWLLTLIFSGVIAFPALFLTPGPDVLSLPLGLAVTRTGLTSACFLLLRTTTSVTAATSMVLTTRWNQVLKALGTMRLPVAVVLMLEMTYRYIHMLLHSAADMYLTRKSRIIRRLSGAESRRMAAANTGTLLVKSLQMSSEVYLSMRSRGFRGIPRTLNDFQVHPGDWIYTAAVAGASAAALILGG